MQYQHLCGPDFLAALAESEMNRGNDANAIEFRRRHRDWTLDQDALRRARELNASLEWEVLELRRQLNSKRRGGCESTTQMLPEIAAHHYAPGAIRILSELDAYGQSERIAASEGQLRNFGPTFAGVLDDALTRWQRARRAIGSALNWLMGVP